jgi:hypothetical protein
MVMIKVTKTWEKTHSNTMWDEICDWCVQNFGNDYQRWKTQATLGYMDFMFEHDEDAALFIMKWM